MLAIFASWLSTATVLVVSILFGLNFGPDRGLFPVTTVTLSVLSEIGTVSRCTTVDAALDPGFLDLGATLHFGPGLVFVGGREDAKGDGDSGLKVQLA